MTTTWKQAGRKLAIGVPDAIGEDKLLLQRFVLTEEISRPFCCELTLYSQDTAVDPNKIVGENVTVRLEQGNGQTRYINGYVSRFVQGGEGSDDSAHTYTATVVPWLWLLTRSSDCYIYQDKTIPEIVNEVFGDFGCSELVETNLTATYPKHEYIVQYRETSFNFISRLLEHEGIYYYFKHENGKHKLVLADAPSNHVEVEGYESVPYHDGGNMSSQGITEWMVETRLLPGEQELLDFDFKVPTKDLKGNKILKGEHANADSALFDFPGGYEEKGAGDTRAATRIEELMMNHSVGRARGDARGLTVGCKFNLTSAPRPDHDGEYVITSMTCEATEDGVGRRGGNRLLFKNRFTCVKADTQIRPRRVTPKPVITGPQTAIITTSSDSEEVLVDKFGRVKVHFHWDRYSPMNDTSSCWIRVAQLWAGKGWGAVFIPRKDQEVIVEFLDGDPDRPIITGRVYNGANMPPYALPAEKTKSTIKTNSSTGGEGFNELRFEDKKDSEQVFIHAQKNLDIRVRANTAETTFGNREIRVGADNNGERSGNLNTFVQFDTNTHIKEGRYEKIEKKVNVTVIEDVVEDFQMNHTVTVAEKIAMNAAEYLLETGDKIDLKSGATKIAGTDTLDLKGSATKIEGTQSIDLKTAAVKIAGSSTIDAKGATVNIEGAQTINIKGGMNVNIEGGTGVSLKCGGNAIVIDPSGVGIQGTMIKLNMGAAGGPATSAASAGSAAEAAAFEAAEIEEPIDAIAAVNDRHGGSGGGTATPRTRTRRTPVPVHAPPFQPPPPPPQNPQPGSNDSPMSTETRRFVEIHWLEQQCYCGGPATLAGSTVGYAENSSEQGQVRNTMDGATVTSVQLVILGNAFNKPVEVKNWLPRKSGANYEEFRDEDGFAAGMKTPVPLRMNFIPNLTKTACSIGNSQFELVVSNYKATVEGNITYVKGFMAWLIQLGNTVPAGTGGQAGVNWGTQVAGSFSGTDWRFCKDDTSSPSGKVYWDGSAWQNVPDTWSDTGNVKLYGIGIWREGSSNKAQFGNSWPEAIPAWGPAQQAIADSTIPGWVRDTNGAWTDKFDLKRDGCQSTDQTCCRYPVKITMGFTAVATRSGHTIIIGVNNGRSNAGAWSLGDTRPALAPHEFGHHLNNPDEYVGGVGIDTSVNTDGATNGIDPTSLMGSVPASSIPPVKARHFNTIKQHLSAMINTQKGVSWTFTAVAHT